MATRIDELELPEVDLFGVARAEALALLGEARKAHWIVRNQFGYSVTRYDDVIAILRDRRFHSALAYMPANNGGMALPDQGPSASGSILTMEGPNHSRLRRLAAPAFTPKAADRLRPFMREVVNGLVDNVAAAGRCELVEDICEPYPIPIVCELLGAPKEDWKLFSNWATDIFRIFNGDFENDAEKITAASEELTAYVLELIAQRRDRPRDDLLSDMIAAEEAGDRMSTDELVMMTEAVLMAGTDTTRNQLACSVALFTENPDQWALLAERPELGLPRRRGDDARCSAPFGERHGSLQRTSSTATCCSRLARSWPPASHRPTSTIPCSRTRSASTSPGKRDHRR